VKLSAAHSKPET